MKRIGNLYDKICSMDNLIEADRKARKNKRRRKEIVLFDQNREENLQKLRDTLLKGEFRTSAYKTFTIYEPKERLICRLPYYPDRIVHHAILNVLEPIWVSTFTTDSYSCIKKRGIHACAQSVKKALRKYPDQTTYCLKFDIRKYYPSIHHDTMKAIVRRKIKDARLLSLIDEIIDSYSTLPDEYILSDGCGLPIGNYMSQYLANLYLTYFDHWIKEQNGVRFYWRYADDIVILSDDKCYLHELLADIKEYLEENLKLHIKPNHQIFPVDARSIDFVGYRFYHTHTLIRKGIKKRFCRAVAKLLKRGVTELKQLKMSLCGWTGWAKYCDSINLFKTLNIYQLCS